MFLIKWILTCLLLLLLSGLVFAFFDSKTYIIKRDFNGFDSNGWSVNDFNSVVTHARAGAGMTISCSGSDQNGDCLFSATGTGGGFGDFNFFTLFKPAFDSNFLNGWNDYFDGNFLRLWNSYFDGNLLAKKDNNGFFWNKVTDTNSIVTRLEGSGVSCNGSDRNGICLITPINPQPYVLPWLDANVSLTSLSDGNIVDLSWTKLKNYPVSCGNGQAVQAVGDVLACVDLNSTSSIVSNLHLYFFKEASGVLDYNVMRAASTFGGPYGFVKSFAASDENLVAFRSRDLNVTVISAGTIEVHFHAQKTNLGSKDLRLYAKLFKRDLAGNETLLVTTENSGLIDALSAYDIHATIANTPLLITDQVVLKFYSVVSGGGVNPDINFIIDDQTFSGLTLPNLIDFNFLANTYVPYNGALKNVNLGDKNITAQWFFGKTDWTDINGKPYFLTMTDVDLNIRPSIDANRIKAEQNVSPLIDGNLVLAKQYTDSRFGSDRNADQRIFPLIDGNANLTLKKADANGQYVDRFNTQTIRGLKTFLNNTNWGNNADVNLHAITVTDEILLPTGSIDSSNTTGVRMFNGGSAQNIQAKGLFLGNTYVGAGLLPATGGIKMTGDLNIINDGNAILANDLIVKGTVFADVNDMVTNGGFNDTSAWTRDPSWAIVAGLASCSPCVSGQKIQQNVSAIAGHKYRVKMTVSGYTGTPISDFVMPSIGGANGTVKNAIGTFVDEITAVNSNNLIFTSQTPISFVITIDNISVYDSNLNKYVFGNPELDSNMGSYSTIDSSGNFIAGNRTSKTYTRIGTDANVTIGNDLNVLDRAFLNNGKVRITDGNIIPDLNARYFIGSVGRSFSTVFARRFISGSTKGIDDGTALEKINSIKPDAITGVIEDSTLPDFIKYTGVDDDGVSAYGRDLELTDNLLIAGQQEEDAKVAALEARIAYLECKTDLTCSLSQGLTAIKDFIDHYTKPTGTPTG